ncbi:MAG: hypothetical protein OER80_10670 [Gammaproteobacteria bacterium]|nr:hypothetical protein [Gammaproteobacteria bacterium]
MPWQLSYAASAELENSELQTDVMRFMAILAFCLVAIFAIVQSIPLEPRQSQTPAVETKRVVEIPQPAPIPRPAPAKAKPTPGPKPLTKVAQPQPKTVAKPVRSQRPEPVNLPTPAAAPKPVPREIRAPVVERTTLAVPTPVPVQTAPPARQGLSLSFESDAVLRSLVEQQRVSLFAIDGETFYRMSVMGSRIDFASGATPAQYHEMVFETVPVEVAQSFELQHAGRARDVIWGVTLPAGTTLQLQRFVQTNFSGSLIITADAKLALAGSK